MQLARIWRIVRGTVSRWLAHNPSREGASIAYYTVLAMAPLVVFLAIFISTILGSDKAQQQIIGYAQQLAGDTAAQTIQGLLMSAKKPEHGSLAGLLATIALILGASAVFAEVREALNTIWDAHRPAQGLWGVMRQKVFAFLLVIAAGFLLLSSMLATAVVSVIRGYLQDIVPIPAIVLQVADVALSLGTLAAVFALMFRYLPDIKLPWKVVWTGAAVAAPLFVLGKILLGLYLSWAAVGSAYGAAGSLVVITVWVYYSAQIFLLGAEFTYVWAENTYPRELAEAKQEPPQAQFRPSTAHPIPGRT